MLGHKYLSEEAVVPNDLFTKWLEAISTPHKGVTLYGERKGARAIALKALKPVLADHFVGEAIIMQAGGYTKAAAIITNSLPTNKKTRSGDLCEVLGTEYINSETPFVVPIKKLRWKSDREMPMHGNDVIGIDTTTRPVRVLKGECKSRAVFGKAVVTEAADTLDLHDGRPNPSTLAFITKRLYEDKRDDEANVFRDLQCARTINPKSITHMIFVLAGNDPSEDLAGGPKPKRTGITRENAAILVNGHAAFVAAVYKTYGA
jgi:hypothetical protein